MLLFNLLLSESSTNPLVGSDNPLVDSDMNNIVIARDLFESLEKSTLDFRSIEHINIVLHIFNIFRNNYRVTHSLEKLQCAKGAAVATHRNVHTVRVEISCPLASGKTINIYLLLNCKDEKPVCEKVLFEKESLWWFCPIEEKTFRVIRSTDHEHFDESSYTDSTDMFLNLQNYLNISADVAYKLFDVLHLNIIEIAAASPTSGGDCVHLGSDLPKYLNDLNRAK